MHDRQADWTRLFRAANAGDARAYGLFLNAVTPVLRAVVRARGAGLPEADCEDVVQEVLLAIHLKRHTWREDEPAAPWCYAIARHKVVDAFRKRGRRIHLPVEDFAEILPAAPETDPTEQADIETFLGHLEPRAEQLVRAIGLEGKSIAETGDAMDMSEGAVRVMLHRSLKKLAALRERLIEI
ncbi:sigD protein [Thioclava sp. L04-15]|uniref:sigma-70 family RNA polymerase sigma factor n=1 Tax=Thioclava sp. L04-15 TaxID=1915318 RepID=UPI000997984C|nr:sigma-70 family RNA polymerase sigma factor [Thioclava sp. L04-15]OOY29898.1 sigD protein [Thioclava sp. L04-15]TNE85877.1 MAG: sigma-70 family RNA polymerase sigma factor [Paracoccaceae bacterium]